MAKLSDEELLQKYDDLDWHEIQFATSSEYVAHAKELRAEILKRMGKVDVAGIAREIVSFCAYSWQQPGPQQEDPIAKIETILRSHLEGKSE